MTKIEFIDKVIDVSELYTVLMNLDALSAKTKQDLAKSNNLVSMLNVLNLSEVYDGIVLSKAGKSSDLYLIERDADGNWMTNDGRVLKTKDEKNTALKIAVDAAIKGLDLPPAGAAGILLCELKSIARDFETFLNFICARLEFSSNGSDYFFKVKRGKEEKRFFIFAFNSKFDTLKSLLFATDDNETIDTIVSLLQKAKGITEFLKQQYETYHLPKMGRVYNRSSLIFGVALLANNNAWWVRDEFGRWNFSRRFSKRKSLSFIEIATNMFNLDKTMFTLLLHDGLIQIAREYNKAFNDLLELLDESTTYHLNYDKNKDALKLMKEQANADYVYLNANGEIAFCKLSDFQNQYRQQLRDLFLATQIDLDDEFLDKLVYTPRWAKMTIESGALSKSEREVYSITAIAFSLAAREFEELDKDEYLAAVAKPIDYLTDEQIDNYIETAKKNEESRRAKVKAKKKHLM